MADLRSAKDLSRTLYHHQWGSLDEWVDSIYALAEMDDDEIAALASPRRLSPETAILT